MNKQNWDSQGARAILPHDDLRTIYHHIFFN